MKTNLTFEDTHKETNLTFGIAGGSGSGKSALAENIIKYLNRYTRYKNQVCFLDFDRYYIPLDHLTMPERKKFNFDHPHAIDWMLFIQHLSDLKNNKSIKCPKYDFAVYNRIEQFDIIEPRPIILSAGHLLFHNPDVRELFDHRIFLDVDGETRLGRRIARDTDSGEGRGRTVRDVLDQWFNFAKPGYDEYVKKAKQHCEISFLLGGQNVKGIKIVCSYFKTELNKFFKKNGQPKGN